MAYFELNGERLTGDVLAEGVVIPYGNLLIWPDDDLAAYGITKHDDPIAPAPVPQSVTPLQARKALRQAGLKAQVDAYVATLSEEAQEEWEYCIAVERSNGLVSNAATALGMSEQQKDDLFRLAATL